MVENYMDYSNDLCMNMFTNIQIDVMRAVIEIARPGLIEGQDDLNCLVGDVNFDAVIIKIPFAEVSSFSSFLFTLSPKTILCRI